MDGDEDFGTLCICAVRYAIGRATYMPEIVTRFISAHLRELSNKDLFVISRDIREYGFGDDLNFDTWFSFRERIEAELKRRAAE